MDASARFEWEEEEPGLCDARWDWRLCTAPVDEAGSVKTEAAGSENPAPAEMVKPSTRFVFVSWLTGTKVVKSPSTSVITNVGRTTEPLFGLASQP